MSSASSAASQVSANHAASVTFWSTGDEELDSWLVASEAHVSLLVRLAQIQSPACRQQVVAACRAFGDGGGAWQIMLHRCLTLAITASNGFVSYREAALGGFRHHPAIDEWCRQWTVDRGRFRYKFLLLRGACRMSTRYKAISVHGQLQTLIVDCQGLGERRFPNLRLLQRSRHRCVVFENICCQQVLAHKVLFQAAPWPLSLARRGSSQSLYKNNVHGLAIICCSQTFRKSVAEGVSADDALWLSDNLIEASPIDGVTWYSAEDSA